MHMEVLLSMKTNFLKNVFQTIEKTQQCPVEHFPALKRMSGINNTSST